jgi:dihydrofolate reductase
MINAATVGQGPLPPADGEDLSSEPIDVVVLRAAAPSRAPDGGVLMGRLVYSMSVSLDGDVNTSSRSLDWVNVDEELHSFFSDEARAMSASLYGRRMYELMTDYWPTADADPSATPAMLEFARIWRDKPKIVFSRTLTGVDWNSRLVRDDAAREFARLKAQPGFDMDVGGPTLASTLIRAPGPASVRARVGGHDPLPMRSDSALAGRQ